MDDITIERVFDNGAAYKVYDSTLNSLTFTYCGSPPSIDSVKNKFKEWVEDDYNPYLMLSHAEQNEIDGGFKRRVKKIHSIPRG